MGPSAPLRLSCRFAAWLLAFLVAAPAVAMQIAAYPQAGQRVGDTVGVSVAIDSSAAVTAVQASIGGVGSALTSTLGNCAPACRSYWSGQLDLSSLARGAQTFTVTATDSNGATATTTYSVTHDNPPRVSLLSPVARSSVVARQVSISATCADDDPAGCVSLSVVMTGAYSAVEASITGTSSVSTVLPVPCASASWHQIAVVATDSAGQKEATSASVFCEPNARYSIADTVPGTILDADDQRILYMPDGAPYDRLFVRDRASGSDALVYGGTLGMPTPAFLTPAGIAIAISSGAGGNGTIAVPPPAAGATFVLPTPFVIKSMERGTLVDLGTGWNLQHSGPYVAWLDGASSSILHRRDVTTGITSNFALPHPVAGYDFDLGADGTLMYSDSLGQVSRVTVAGNIMAVTTAPPLADQFPVGTADTAAYMQLPRGVAGDTTVLGAGDTRLLLNQGGVESEVARWAGYYPFANQFELANGRLAFLAPDASHVLQAWRRDASGTVSQLSHGAAVLYLHALEASGRLLFSSSDQRLRVAPANASDSVPVSALYTPKVVSTSAATYLISGGSLLELQLHGLAVSGPAVLNFGNQSLGTSATASLTVVNLDDTPGSIGSLVTTGAGFSASTDCGATPAVVPAAGSCTVTVSFDPATPGAANGTLTIATSSGNFTVNLSATGENSLVTHYYRSILQREPDPAGKAFWESEAQRVIAMGGDVSEAWNAMAMTFFASAEYRALMHDDAGYIADLYATFFDRAPDAAGTAYWLDQLERGVPRDGVLVSFMLSPEFAAITSRAFGATPARPEVGVTMDFYRGLLGRLPDSAGFTYNVGLFRQAQCAGPDTVRARADAVSKAFIGSAEYAARARDDGQFVADLYDAFLRRGMDLDGGGYWMTRLAQGMPREDVRRAFVESTEFTARVQQVINAGCAL